ncbi:hypothetical protein F385_3898 [Pantoea agglomerans 299R]|nr:hypothetical protein F385_3898 [Pantoea agglomerans 299R]
MQDLFCPVPAPDHPQDDPIKSGRQDAVKLLKSSFITAGYLVH